MRIWLQKHTVEGRLPLLDQWYREHIAQLTAADTTVDVHSLPAGAYPADIPASVVRFGSVETFFAGYFAQQALNAERAGYDAFVIATSQDPGLREARSLVEIPVLGYGETSFHFAAMSGQRFAIVGCVKELAEPLEENIRRHGLIHKFCGFEYLDDGPAVIQKALGGDGDELFKGFEDAAERAVARGAQLIIPGEGLPNEALWHAGITEIGGAHIVDSDGLLLKAAELMVFLRNSKMLGRSSRGYWMGRPGADYLDHLAGVFWASDYGNSAQETTE